MELTFTRYTHSSHVVVRISVKYNQLYCKTPFNLHTSQLVTKWIKINALVFHLSFCKCLGCSFYWECQQIGSLEDQELYMPDASGKEYTAEKFATEKLPHQLPLIVDMVMLFGKTNVPTAVTSAHSSTEGESQCLKLHPFNRCSSQGMFCFVWPQLKNQHILLYATYIFQLIQGFRLLWRIKPF